MIPSKRVTKAEEDEITSQKPGFGAKRYDAYSAILPITVVSVIIKAYTKNFCDLKIVRISLLKLLNIELFDFPITSLELSPISPSDKIQIII